MDRGRKEGARSNRHRRSMEDMRNAVTSTPAVEPLELEYEETTTEDPYSSDTSGHTNESDDSEASFKGFSHKEYLKEPSTAQRQTCRTRN